MRHRPVIGYVIVAVMLAFLFWRQQEQTQRLEQEIEARRAFDDRRAYELCLSGNEARKAIQDAIIGAGEDIIDVSRRAQARSGAVLTEPQKQLRDENEADYRAKLKKRVEPIGPRKCEVRPQNSAGPQR